MRAHTKLTYYTLQQSAQAKTFRDLSEEERYHPSQPSSCSEHSVVMCRHESATTRQTESRILDGKVRGIQLPFTLSNVASQWSYLPHLCWLSPAAWFISEVYQRGTNMATMNRGPTLTELSRRILTTAGAVLILSNLDGTVVGLFFFWGGGGGITNQTLRKCNCKCPLSNK